MSFDKDFYLKHYDNFSLNTTVDFSVEYRKKGHRYYCLYDFLDNKKQYVAIEWGGGTLSKALYLSNLFKEFNVVDIAAYLIMEKEKLDSSSLPFKLNDYNLNEDLPYSENQFDIVIAMMVIEHLFDPFHSFKEIARITKKEGYIFVNLPLITSIKNRLRLLFGELPVISSKKWWEHEEWDGGHLHYFTIDSIQRLGEKYRLRLIKTYPVGRLYGLKLLFPRLLCNEMSFVFQKL